MLLSTIQGVSGLWAEIKPVAVRQSFEKTALQVFDDAFEELQDGQPIHKGTTLGLRVCLYAEALTCSESQKTDMHPIITFSPACRSALMQVPGSFIQRSLMAEVSLVSTCRVGLTDCSPPPQPILPYETCSTGSYASHELAYAPSSSSMALTALLSSVVIAYIAEVIPCNVTLNGLWKPLGSSGGL